MPEVRTADLRARPVFVLQDDGKGGDGVGARSSRPVGRGDPAGSGEKSV